MTMIDPVTLALVKSALDAGVMRQVVHANNIANANTPGYRPFEVLFEESLQSVRDAVESGGANEVDPASVPSAHMQQQPVGATVSLDGEVASMSQDALQYQALTKALGRQYALLGLAASDGKR